MPAYLLDTNVVSELERSDRNSRLESRLRTHQAVCVIAAPVIQELVFGIARLAPSARRTRLEQWFKETLETFEVLAYDARAAEWLGREQARLASLGRRIPLIDAQIAAVAVTHNLTLVTRDTGDFEGFAGLRTENWFAR